MTTSSHFPFFNGFFTKTLFLRHGEALSIFSSIKNSWPLLSFRAVKVITGLLPHSELDVLFIWVRMFRFYSVCKIISYTHWNIQCTWKRWVNDLLNFIFDRILNFHLNSMLSPLIAFSSFLCPLFGVTLISTLWTPFLLPLLTGSQLTYSSLWKSLNLKTSPALQVLVPPHLMCLCPLGAVGQ